LVLGSAPRKPRKTPTSLGSPPNYGASLTAWLCVIKIEIRKNYDELYNIKLDVNVIIYLYIIPRFIKMN